MFLVSDFVVYTAPEYGMATSSIDDGVQVVNLSYLDEKIPGR